MVRLWKYCLKMEKNVVCISLPLTVIIVQNILRTKLKLTLKSDEMASTAYPPAL